MKILVACCMLHIMLHEPPHFTRHWRSRVLLHLTSINDHPWGVSAPRRACRGRGTTFKPAAASQNVRAAVHDATHSSGGNFNISININISVLKRLANNKLRPRERVYFPSCCNISFVVSRTLLATRADDTYVQGSCWVTSRLIYAVVDSHANMCHVELPANSQVETKPTSILPSAGHRIPG